MPNNLFPLFIASVKFLELCDYVVICLLVCMPTSLRISILLYSRALHSLPVNIDPIPKDIIEDFGLLSLHSVSEPAAFLCSLNFLWHTLVFFILHVTLPCFSFYSTCMVEQ